MVTCFNRLQICSQPIAFHCALIALQPRVVNLLLATRLFNSQFARFSSAYAPSFKTWIKNISNFLLSSWFCGISRHVCSNSLVKTEDWRKWKQFTSNKRGSPARCSWKCPRYSPAQLFLCEWRIISTLDRRSCQGAVGMINQSLHSPFSLQLWMVRKYGEWRDEFFNLK